jgi:hypothetical protein
MTCCRVINLIQQARHSRERRSESELTEMAQTIVAWLDKLNGFDNSQWYPRPLGNLNEPIIVPGPNVESPQEYILLLDYVLMLSRSTYSQVTRL